MWTGVSSRSQRQTRKKRTDSVHLEKNSVSIGRGRRRSSSVAPLFLFGRTERSDRTGTNSRLFDADEHRRRWMWTPFCRVARVEDTVRADSAGEAQDYAWTQHVFLHTVTTGRMTTSSLAPFRSFLCSLVVDEH